MNTRVCLIGAMAIGLFCLAGTAEATTFFWDDFESQANYATSWVEEADKDPGTPPIGEGWTMMESPQDSRVQVWRDPVAGGGIQTPYGDQFLHLWRDGGGDSQAWGNVTTAGQTQMATETGLRTEFDVYVLTPDGWGGNLAIGAFDSAPQNWSNRAFDVTFRGDGTVDLYDGSTFQDSGLNAAFGTDAWNHVVIDTNFATDTWSIQIGSATVSGIGFEGNADLSKIQNFILSATDRAGLPGRGGFDNLRLQSVPEPSAFALLTAGIVGLLAYAWRKRK